MSKGLDINQHRMRLDAMERVQKRAMQESGSVEHLFVQLDNGERALGVSRGVEPLSPQPGIGTDVHRRVLRPCRWGYACTIAVINAAVMPYVRARVARQLFTYLLFVSCLLVQVCADTHVRLLVCLYVLFVFDVWPLMYLLDVECVSNILCHQQPRVWKLSVGVLEDT